MWALFSLSGIGIFTYKFGFIYAGLILVTTHRRFNEHPFALKPPNFLYFMFTQMLNPIFVVVSESIHFRTEAKLFFSEQRTVLGFLEETSSLCPIKCSATSCSLHTKCGYMVKQSMAGILQQQKQSVNTERFGDKYDRASLRRKINILRKKFASRCFPLKEPQMRHRFPLSNSTHQHSSLRKKIRSGNSHPSPFLPGLLPVTSLILLFHKDCSLGSQQSKLFSIH